MTGSRKHQAVVISLFLLITCGCTRKEPRNYVEDFWEAIERGNVRKVKAMMAKYPMISQRVGYPGKTALHVAASSGQTEITQLLIKHWKRRGLGVDPTDVPRNRTPLHHAVLAEHKDVVVLLLENGASVRSKDSGGYTALHLAAKQGHDGSIAALLVKYGANVNERSHEGLTPLHVAALKGDNDTIRVLITAGADINAHTSDGLTPMKMAAQNGHSETIELLQTLRRSRNGK